MMVKGPIDAEWLPLLLKGFGYTFTVAYHLVCVWVLCELTITLMQSALSILKNAA